MGDMDVQIDLVLWMGDQVDKQMSSFYDSCSVFECLITIFDSLNLQLKRTSWVLRYVCNE